MSRFLSKLALIIILLLSYSCSSNNIVKNIDQIPSWYITPTQNNSDNLYGVANGRSIEEATKYALADAASRLIVNIAAKSKLIRQENNHDVNEEINQQVQQSIENISFSNFKISNSAKLNQNFFIEVKIKRQPFIYDQEEQVNFLNKKIANLDKNSKGKNAILRRNSLSKILKLLEELELKQRILMGAGNKVNLNKTLNKIANYQNEFAKFNNKIEFYFEAKSNKAIAKIIRNALNKKQIKVTKKSNPANKNQITLKITSQNSDNKIYGAFITKINIDFENRNKSKIIASNSMEVSGSSTIGKKQSYLSALNSLQQKITQDGILQVIGILE